jgi:hypothetical protein
VAPSGAATQIKSPVPAGPRYKLTVNTTPWAYFTVDDDPEKHQTIDSVQLAPGPHRLHFWNDQLGVTKDVTVDVPAHDSSWVGKLGD